MITKMRFARVALVGSLLLLAAAPSTAAEAAPIHQLRTYELFDNSKAAFHSRFRDHGMRIMQRHGFKILSMWETQTDGRSQLVYLLEWPNEEVMRRSWAAFMADEEWAEIKRQTGAQHGRMVGGIEEQTLFPLPHSPGLLGK